jgi:hypothetical protein
VGARRDQEVRWRCGSVVAVVREFVLSAERRVLDRAVNPHARELQQVSDDLVSVRCAARRPAA